MAAPRLLDRPQTTVYELQRDVRDTFRALGVVATGLLVRDVSVGTSDTPLAHGLRSAPAAVFAMPHSDARVWRVSVDSSVVVLRASSAAVCDVMIVP